MRFAALPIVGCLLALAVAAPRAHAFGLNAVGGVNFSVPRDSNDTAYTADLAPAFGFGVEFRLLPFLDLELDGLWVTRKYGLPPSGTTTITGTERAFEVPILARLRVFPGFTLGAGVYYLSYRGDIEASIQTGSGEPTKSTLDRAAGQRTTSDYGGVVSARALFPLSHALGAFVDARLTMSVRNNSEVQGGSLKFWDSQLLAGLQLSLGGH